MALRIPLADEERPHLSSFVIVYALTIVAWACAHDLYLIGVEPRHFTVYHRPLLPLSNPILLAVQYAAVATFGPGMVFGALAWAVSRVGTQPRLGLRTAWCAFLPFIAVIETTSLICGAIARSRHAAGLPLPYPGRLYPDDTAGIAYSQSVNITAYAGAAIFGVAYLFTLRAWRRAKTT